MSRNPLTYVLDNSQPVHLWRAIKTDSNAWPTSKVTFLVRAVSHQEAMFLAQHDPCVKSPADMVHVDFEPIKLAYDMPSWFGAFLLLHLQQGLERYLS